MHITIVGGGIGGLVAALSLHATGIDCAVYEQVREVRELGVGINTLPHAIKELTALGLLPALDRAGIRTRELIYANRFGQVVWRELRGTDAGFDTPQFSIHRGKLHSVLLAAVLERLGSERVHTGARLLGFAEHRGQVISRFERRDNGATFEVASDALVGADGIHSVVRAAFYPDEGPPVWNGIMLWRGAADWPVHVDGRTMVISGGMGAKFVFYPIHSDPARPGSAPDQLGGAGPHRFRRRDRHDGRTGTAQDGWRELEPIVRGGFRLGFVDLLALIRASGTFYEYPMCDRDPLPRWSFRPRHAARRRGAPDVPGRLQRRQPGGAGRAGAGPPPRLRRADSGCACRVRRRAPADDRGNRADQPQRRTGASDRRAGGTGARRFR